MPRQNALLAAGFDKDGRNFTLGWGSSPAQHLASRPRSLPADGFTPFNNKGVMAILRQGAFDIVLPVTDMLEILPSQPHRDLLEVNIQKTEDGRIRVSGNFSKLPWQLPWYHKPEGAKTEIVEMREVSPVLMLRKVENQPVPAHPSPMTQAGSTMAGYTVA